MEENLPKAADILDDENPEIRVIFLRPQKVMDQDSPSLRLKKYSESPKLPGKYQQVLQYFSFLIPEVFPREVPILLLEK